MIPHYFQPAIPPSLQRRPLSPHIHLIVVGAVLLSVVPAAIVSMIAETQFEGAMPTGLAVLAAILGFAALVLRNHSLRTRPMLAAFVFIIFALRLSVALGIGHWWWWPQAVGASGNDWDVYEALGWDLAQSGLSLEAITLYPLNEVGVVYLVGILYSITGRNPLVLTAVFTLFAGWIALVVADLVTMVGGARAGTRAALFAIVMPASMLLGSMPAKDIVVALCFLKVIEISMRVHGQRGWRARDVAQAVTLMFLTVILRASAAAILLVSLMGIYVAYGWGGILTTGRRRIRLAHIALIAVLAFVGFAALAWRGTRLERGVSLSPITVGQFVYDRTGQPGATLSQAGLTFMTDEASSIAIRTYWDGQLSRAYLIPLRAALLIFVPFPPYHFDSLDMAIGSLNTALMLLLAPAAWAAVAHHRSGWGTSIGQLSRLWIPLVFHLLALSVALPFVLARHALLSQFLFLGLASIGLRKSRRLVTLYLLLPIASALLIVVYMIIKGS